MAIGLSRCIFSDKLSTFYSLQDLRDMIASGESFGFYQPDSGYAGVMDIISHPSRKILYVHHGGKDDSTEGTIDYEEMDRFFQDVCKAFGCSLIQVEGRRGWERKVKHLGYQLETINIFKEVTL